MAEFIEDVKEEIKPLERRTAAENKKLAIDIVESRVFGSWSLQDMSLLPMVFMPIALVDQFPPNLGHVYEYYSEASPRSLNGMPMFGSCRMLSKEDWDEVYPLVMKLEKQRQEFLEEDGAEHFLG